MSTFGDAEYLTYAPVPGYVPDTHDALHWW